MRKFYELFSNEKLTPLVSKLNWSHYVILLSIKDIDEIIYYINVSVHHNLNKRELQNRVINKEYKNLGIDVKNKLSNRLNVELIELMLNPIVIKIKDDNKKLSEY